jgi:hypothetical protein
MSIPYLSAPGNILKAFSAIQAAATPERVSQDFVKTVLKIGGSSGDQMTAFLRRIGFSGVDGVPTELYRRFRNTVTAGHAMAEAIKKTYGELSTRNEFFYLLPDEKLKGVIVEVSGEAPDSRPMGLMLSTLRNLISLADFETTKSKDIDASTDISRLQDYSSKENYDKKNENLALKDIKMNLGYTINLNLPATTDIEVFNAIFKSLREHLLNE